MTQSYCNNSTTDFSNTCFFTFLHAFIKSFTYGEAFNYLQ